MEFIFISLVAIAMVPFYQLTLIMWKESPLWSKLSSIFIVVLIIFCTWNIGTSSLSKPKPVSFEYVSRGIGVVESAIIEENVGIYIWVTFDSAEPRYYVIPWNKDTAEELQDALNEGNGVQFFMFDHDWEEDDPVFHPMPQPAPFPKNDIQQEPPRRFDAET